MVVPSYATYQAVGRRSPIFSTKGVVCSSQPLASEAGLTILRNGGNAVDAAIAVAAALNVTEPCNCGIGGDVFALYWDAKERKVKALNGSGRSPMALSLSKAREMGITESRLPYSNVNAVTVPGSAAAWVDLHREWGSGKMSLNDILKPATDLAEEGFAIHPQAAYEWSTYLSNLQAACDGPSYPFLIDGEPPKPGQFFRNPALAETFRVVGEHGKGGFYKGRIAQAIVDSITTRGGVMTLADLEAHESEFVEPISYTYGEEKMTVYECPPNGQGLAVLIALGILDALREDGVLDLEQVEEGSAEWLHALIEAMRLAFADAHGLIADPKFSDVPVDVLLSKPYLRERAKLFDPKVAEAQYKQGRPIPSGDTVYFTTADSEGNAMSMIMSNFLGFGSAIVPQDCGFSLQNRGGGFHLKEGSPNVLEGGKRPFHTIIPAMVTQGDELYVSFGVMGGAMQPQGHLQVLLNLLHHKHHPQAALDARRFCIGGHAWSKDGKEEFYNRIIAIEDGVKPEVIATLQAMGHKLDIVKGYEQVLFGKGQIIMRTVDQRAGKRVWVAGSDPRGDGCALAQI